MKDHDVFCSRQYREEHGEAKGGRTYHGFAARERRVLRNFLGVAKPGSVWSDRRLG